MAYGGFKGLLRTLISGKVLPDKVFFIAKCPNMMETKKDLLQWFRNILIKSSLRILQELILILKTKNKKNKYSNQLYENFRNIKYIYSLKTTFGMLILWK